MPASTLSHTRLDAASPRLSRERRALPDGAHTTVHVGRFDRGAFALSVVPVEPCSTLVEWCAAAGADHAIVGGFYMRPGGPPLGDLWVDGKALPTTPFDSPWDRCRACVHADAGAVALLAREEIEGPPRGDLLQAGPMLVRDGAMTVHPGVDAEGFSAGSRQFDSDISAGRYPRAALGLAGPDLVAVVCDGRADDDAGMTMAELAETMVALGCADAMNLDGGGSASLVVDGKLVNTPREEHGLELRGGREIATALRLSPR
ncbi:MAG TPA: phosphodiester glycosidase family protein [Solirubrobacterales bacterium]|nr:phosphodiester glycosidase family protein [Solirubrobacterales bacterium]